MLDEFDQPSHDQNSKPSGTVGTDEVIDEDWARQLQEGMADLLGDMNQDEKMQDQFAHLAKELNEAMSSSQNSSPSAQTRPISSHNINFQERIKQAMDRMQSSEEQVGAAVADSKEDSFLSEMLKQMQNPSADGGEEDFSTMLVGMMEQLTSKEILYEPMKELGEKYPEWIAKNHSKETPEDIERYRGQYTIVKEIVDKFEETGYRDEDEKHREYIIERMQRMQSAGAPPKELMGDMPMGLGSDEVDIGDCGVQ
ncbi:Pex19 protein [Geopyxis carbonaria]|nr:Pex19 protein [Geopyxis carbonaria]